ncbi:hypothetical protein [Shewanella sp. 10N.286.48.A6]|uniref:hypothetical protein n=1 Tax=Shewanella sp. 10N.286.48.A6 TaxID=1880833 RepID=UPI0039A5390D
MVSHFSLVLCLKVDIETTIVVTGLIVLFISVLGGAWGIVCFRLCTNGCDHGGDGGLCCGCIGEIGGPANHLSSNSQPAIVMGSDMNYPLLFVSWFIFMFVKQLQNINNMQDSYRFLTAKDSVNARKAALLAFVLMLIGPAIWFLPPWVTAIIYPEAATMHAARTW